MLRNIIACACFLWLAAGCLNALAQPQVVPSDWVPAERTRDAAAREVDQVNAEFQLAQGGSSSLADRLKAIRGAAPLEPLDAPVSRPAPPAAASVADSAGGPPLPSVLVRRGTSPPGSDAADDPGTAPSPSAASEPRSVPAEPAEPAPLSPSAAGAGQLPAGADEAFDSTRRTARRMPRETETVRAPQVLSGVSAGSTAGAPLALSQQGPLLTVETEGPRAILVGKEASYRVRVTNQGSAEADRVIVSVALPAWVQVTKTAARLGTVSTAGDQRGASPLTWDLERVPPRSQQELTLTLLPTENRPVELAVDWVFRATSMQASIDVQQPQLAIAVEGPSELRYGTTGVFKIKVSNPGNGPAEGVTLTMSTGSGTSQPQAVGVLAAGETRTLEIELAAQQAGAMALQALAQGDGNLRAEAQHEVRVRRAQLAVKVTAPALLYAGATAQYEIRVANGGDAPAEGVTLEVELPSGMQNALGVDKKSIDGSASRWRLGDLPPGSDRVYKMQGDLTAGGENRLAARVTSNDQSTASDLAVTQVEAIADLKLIVNDPQGPLPVGRDVTYEILVVNRGSKEAHNIDLVAQFSEGIEPTGTEGHRGQIVPGQVVFEPIRTLPAGGQVAVQVKAKALQPGNLRFRAELSCTDLDTKLSSEFTTRFYSAAGGGAAPGSRPAPAGRAAGRADGSEPTPARR